LAAGVALVAETRSLRRHRRTTLELSEEALPDWATVALGATVPVEELVGCPLDAGKLGTLGRLAAGVKRLGCH